MGEAARATAYGTDCYPRREIETWVNRDTLNQAYLFNPRNAYQNYACATNGSETDHIHLHGGAAAEVRKRDLLQRRQLSPLSERPVLPDDRHRDARLPGGATRVRGLAGYPAQAVVRAVRPEGHRWAGGDARPHR